MAERDRAAVLDFFQRAGQLLRCDGRRDERHERQPERPVRITHFGVSLWWNRFLKLRSWTAAALVTANRRILRTFTLKVQAALPIRYTRNTCERSRLLCGRHR